MYSLRCKKESEKSVVSAANHKEYGSIPLHNRVVPSVLFYNQFRKTKFNTSNSRYNIVGVHMVMRLTGVILYFVDSYCEYKKENGQETTWQMAVEIPSVCLLIWLNWKSTWFVIRGLRVQVPLSAFLTYKLMVSSKPNFSIICTVQRPIRSISSFFGMRGRASDGTRVLYLAGRIVVAT